MDFAVLTGIKSFLFGVCISLVIFSRKEIWRLIVITLRRLTNNMPDDDFPILQVGLIEFNDGSRLDVSKDDLIIIVGPNNSGKSASLREIKNLIIRGKKGEGQIVKSADVYSPQSLVEIEKWLRDNSKTDKRGCKGIPFAGNFNEKYLEDDWSKKGQRGFGDLGDILTLHLSTEERLLAASPVNSIDFAEEIESHPIHRMFIDEDFESVIDSHFFRSFKDHIFVNRGAGSKIRLHVGSSLPSEGESTRRDYLKALNDLPPLHEQGDGMRSFAGVVMSVLSARRRVILLDEPEAFLHPPQAAALGKLLAHHLPKGRQLFIATHSTDFLKGVLDDSSAQVRIIRLRRENKINCVNELDPSKVRSVWSDPLLRYSGILDGLFHDGVVVCEGDTDCRFYSAVVDKILENESSVDILFVHGGGKGRLPMIVNALAAIGVPVKAIADFDVLREEEVMSKIVRAFGAKWEDFKKDWQVVKGAVDKVRAERSTDDIKADIDRIFAQSQGHNLQQEAIDEIKRIVKQASGWEEAKRLGKTYVSPAATYNIYENLEKRLQGIGFFIVPVGEVEGFCRTIGGKGPQWTLKAMEQVFRDSPSLDAARSFCTELVADWRSTAPSSP